MGDAQIRQQASSVGKDSGGMFLDDESGFASVTRIDLPPVDIGILKGILASCLQGLERDLRFAERLRQPDRARRECSAFERLLRWLNQGFVSGSDEAAYAVLKQLAAAADCANGYTAVVAEHDALHGFLASLEAAFLRRIKRGASQKRRAIFLAPHQRAPLGLTACGTQPPGAAPPGEDKATLDLQRGVLGAILREHPQQLTHREIAERLFDDLDEPNAGTP
jgi:hypothetical protein